MGINPVYMLYTTYKVYVIHLLKTIDTGNCYCLNSTSSANKIYFPPLISQDLLILKLKLNKPLVITFLHMIFLLTLLKLSALFPPIACIVRLEKRA